jgi:hypothetical protein
MFRVSHSSDESGFSVCFTDLDAVLVAIDLDRGSLLILRPPFTIKRVENFFRGYRQTLDSDSNRVFDGICNRCGDRNIDHFTYTHTVVGARPSRSF